MNDGIAIHFDLDTFNDCRGNPISPPWSGPPWDYFPPPIKSRYEVVVMADHWYGYTRVGSSSQKSSQTCR
jgi:hypothetical protein